jgi:hypothetical protein
MCKAEKHPSASSDLVPWQRWSLLVSRNRHDGKILPSARIGHGEEFHQLRECPFETRSLSSIQNQLSR